MDDLYATLGVPRDASPEEIAKAYRERAKETHPDAGGKPGEFEAVSRAVAVLKDPKRRKAYDASKPLAEPDPHSDEQKALGMIAQLVEMALRDDEADCDRMDVRGRMVTLLRQEKAASSEALALEMRQQMRAKIMLKRFKRGQRKGRDQPDYMRVVLESALDKINHNIDLKNEHARIVTVALDILDAYRYEVDTSPAWAPITGATTGTGTAAGAYSPRRR